MAKKKIRQRGARRKISGRARPSVPEDSRYDALAEKVFCPECEQAFTVGELEWNGGLKRCPKCGADMGEEAMDERAAATLRELDAAREDERAVAREVEELEASLSVKRHWWQFLSRSRLRRKLEARRARLERFREQVGGLSRGYGHLVYGRYFCSDWFLLSHVPLSRSGIGRDLDYRLRPQVSDGTDAPEFFLSPSRPNRSIGRGIAAEFEFFEFARKASANPDSPLCDARILPDLYLPHVGRGGRTITSQVDCVVLTRSCAFVVEVKSWHSEISAASPFEAVEVKRAGEAERTDAPLYQNSQHALAFDDCCDAYPFERIYELTVFVNPVSFESDGAEFADNVLVSALPDCSGTLLAAMEEVVQGEENLMTQGDLEDLAHSLHDRYCDRYQMLGVIHTHRVRREHAGAKAS